MAYSKLHSSIVGSSLWTEPHSVRLLFITLLAMCDKTGIVYGSKAGLARLANNEPDEAETAWAVLQAPDPHSSDKMRSPEHQGRRLEEVPGGFKLLNFSYYTALRNDDDRREQNRRAQARFKAKVSQGKPAVSKVSRAQPQSAAGETEKPRSAHTDADADADKVPPKAPQGGRVVVFPASLSTEEFTVTWSEWVSFRMAKGGRANWEKLFQKQLEWLAPMGSRVAVSVLNQSMRNGWQGLFELKQEQGKPNGNLNRKLTDAEMLSAATCGRV